MLKKILNYFFKYCIIDTLKVHHMNVTGMNTLTTPKVVLEEVGADPASNGQITMNGGVLKGLNSSSGVMPY